MTNTNESPRIYVASLSDYNAGAPHGAWIDLDGMDVEMLQAAINDVLVSSPEAKRTGLPAEEWAIQGFEGFGSISIQEHASLDHVCDLAAAIIEHGDAYLAYVEWGGDQYANPEDFEDAYLGEYGSLEDWAWEYLEDTGTLSDVPASLRRYIDAAAWAWDAVYSGDIAAVEINGTTHIFHN